MKGIGILTLTVTLFLFIVFNSPKLGKSNPLVDNSGCLECHVMEVVHGMHSSFVCNSCHETPIGGGPAFSSKCIACHPLVSAGHCNLVDFHESSQAYNPSGASCLECHPDCDEGTTTTTTIMDDFCKGLADYDQDVDGTDAFMFKSHFGRNLLKNPCPPNGPAPVPKTGQTTSWATGDDGDLQKGVDWPNPRFIDNGDGTVTDNLTGLIWLKNADCFGPRTWNNALSDSNGLESGECGLTDGSSAGDWRLPHIKELYSLIDIENLPALPSGHPFVDVRPAHYWSSSTYAYNPESALFVLMDLGLVNARNKDDDFIFVWPVRGGH